MLSKLTKMTMVITIIILASLLWVTVVAAQDLSGTGPDFAMTPTDAWMELEPGEYHWYTFNFDYWAGEHAPREMEPLEIRLYSDPFEGATLTLRNEDHAELWRQDGKHEHFGCCVPVELGEDADYDADGKSNYAQWAGQLTMSGKYYMVVEHAKNIEGTVRYRITMTGDGVWFEEEAAAPAPEVEVEVAEPATEAVTAPVEEVAAAPAADSPLLGTGPDYAMAPTDQERTLMPGEYHWYAFDFEYWAGEHAPREMEPLEIRLYSDPFEGATLTLRNEDQAELWRQDGEHAHFGCCVPEELGEDADFDADGKSDYAQWAGQLTSSGRYYIVVEHAKNIAGPVTYRFSMTGDGFSMPAPPAAPIAETVEPVQVEELGIEVAPVVAELASLAGTGPDYAMVPTGEWTEIMPGEYQWYAFHFDFDQEAAESVEQKIEVRLFSDPIEGAILTMRNEDQAELWRQEGEHEHFGCCTLEPLGEGYDFDADGMTDYAIWAGELTSSGTYYMVVEHAKNIDGPVRYRFDITGKNLTFPGMSVTPLVSAVPVSPPPAEIEVPPSLMGTGPDFAMQPTSDWTKLQAGEYHWYAFNYDFDEENSDSIKPVEIRIFGIPTEGAILTIRNEQQAELWRQDGTHEHFGCCTLQDLGEGYDFDADGKTDYAVWSGKLTASGKYYLVVEHAKNITEPVQYLFIIDGDGVTY